MAFADIEPPAISARKSDAGYLQVTLTGQWTLRGVAQHSERLIQEVRGYTSDPEVHWDLEKISAMDSVGAFILFTASDGQRPKHLAVREEHLGFFRRWQERSVPDELPRHKHLFNPIDTARRIGGNAIDHLTGFVSLFGQFALDIGGLVAHPRSIPWRDISANIYHTGVRALSITALLGFLIGVVVAYLSALELKSYGAGNFMVGIAGVGILRELGPVLTAILVAGRSGSAMAAQLGVMRVTQELDALAAMGVSLSLRLVLPKVVALIIVVPLLVMWSDALAMLGAMLSAKATLGIDFPQFLSALPSAVPVSNFWLGIGKGVVYGALIGLVACHFGMRIKPNTESLSTETTNAVVAAITMTIGANAVFAILFKEVGLP